MLAKAIVPYPALDVHVQGMAVLKLPMSDETLCHYLAWLLAEFMPMYYEITTNKWQSFLFPIVAIGV